MMDVYRLRVWTCCFVIHARFHETSRLEAISPLTLDSSASNEKIYLSERLQNNPIGLGDSIIVDESLRESHKQDQFSQRFKLLSACKMTRIES